MVAELNIKPEKERVVILQRTTSQTAGEASKAEIMEALKGLKHNRVAMDCPLGTKLVIAWNYEIAQAILALINKQVDK